MGSAGPLGGRRLRKRGKGRVDASATILRERRGHGVADAVPDGPIPLTPPTTHLDVSNKTAFKPYILSPFTAWVRLPQSR